MGAFLPYQETDVRRLVQPIPVPRQAARKVDLGFHSLRHYLKANVLDKLEVTKPTKQLLLILALNLVNDAWNDGVDIWNSFIETAGLKGYQA